MEESEIKPKFHDIGNKAGVKGADDINKKIETITKGSGLYFYSKVLPTIKGRRKKHRCKSS
jgi:hypothetical protein